VELTGRQAQVVADGFRQAIDEAKYRIHACAILPDHVHLVIGAHPRDIRVAVGHLKSRATRQLRTRGSWHDDARPLWGAHGWNVRLLTLDDVLRAIQYVEENPLKEGKRRQRWSFVVPFDLELAVQTASQVTRRMGAKQQLGGAAMRSTSERRRQV
jgi:REP element-mobilizing transposase RayT